MMTRVVELLAMACFFTGCAVRLWRGAASGGRSQRTNDGADQRARLHVRRPATDVPIEAHANDRPDHDPELP